MRRLEHDDNLEIIRDQLKRRWPALTDADLVYEPGRENDFVARIQARTGEAWEEVEKAIRKAMTTGDVC